MDKKQVIYLDIDEDITELLHKVKSAKQDIVALVLPKRSSVMQSVVNMRLLERVAKNNKKNIVLITSDKSIVSHAALTGLYVASNLNSKPYLPKTDTISQAKSVDEPIEIEQPAKTAPAAIAKEAPKATTQGSSQQSTIAASSNLPVKPTSNKKKKKINIPDFNKFRIALIAGGVALIALIGFGVWAIFFSGSASVIVKTDTTEKPVSFVAVLDTRADEVNPEKKILPTKKETTSAPASEKGPATGTKDVGTKAGGTVSLANCSENAVTIPAGTGVSSGSSTYITQSSVRLDDGNFTGSGTCKTSGGHIGTVSVVAQNNGDQYNADARSYSVSGFSSVKAQGSAMTGGSSKTIKIVSQSDIDTLKAKMIEKQQPVKTELKRALEKEGYTALEDTFVAAESDLRISPAVNSEASEVSVSASYTSTMLGIKQDDIKKVIDKTYEEDIKNASYSVSDYGIDMARLLPDKDGKNLSVETTMKIGPVFEDSELKSLVMGRKQGEAEDLLKEKSGVVEATVTIKPFWKTTVPKKESKINISIESK